eukprot:CAMPEP_0197943864 /NCGR_PEP_ID=MMETSP1439-20131203/125123_1 /TAXON_ID=66791 /ORGANISM="Gonyaulax spinifera, Strain CCMP409" /LENGTH=697 /DNA_ID=CAMNT_0043567119 /DNA_START=63 /DNA_END=2157 /DNA_ORIENTATION=+
MALVEGMDCEAFCGKVHDLLEQGEATKALTLAEKAEEQFMGIEDKQGQASALFMQTLAQARLNDDDPGATLFVAQKAIMALKEAGEKKDLAAACALAGDLYIANGESDEASRVANDAKGSTRSWGFGFASAAPQCPSLQDPHPGRTGTAMALVEGMDREAFCSKAQELIAQGEAARALMLAEKAEEQYMGVEDKQGQASALFMQTLAQARLNDDDPGATLFVAQKAIMALKEAGEKKDLAAACALAGDLYIANGESDEASRVANDATGIYQELGDNSGIAACVLIQADVCLLRDEADNAMDEAKKALSMFNDLGSAGGKASAMHKLSQCHRLNGNSEEALRCAEAASRHWFEVDDMKGQVQAAVAEADAKVKVLEAREESSFTTMHVHQTAKAAVKLAKKFRKKDYACVGQALFAYAKCLVRSNAMKTCCHTAREAVKCFKKVGQDGLVAQATLIWATAEYKMGMFEDASERSQKALALCERAMDDEGKAKALDLMDNINYALGLPTRAELEERQRQLMMQQQQMMMMQQQQQWGNMQMMQQQPQQQQWAPQEEQVAVQPMMMQQQQQWGNMQMMQQQPQQQQWAPQEEQVAVQPGGPAAFQRDGASPLDLSSGMDPAIIRGKVQELAGAIIGDTEDLEADTPLMEAGLTSNSAVLLRDELSKDLPGISLPPTLIFDYPSVATITEFVVEASKKMKK